MTDQYIPVENSPVALEQRMREISNEIARGVAIVDDRYKTYLKTDLDYDTAYARAYLRAEGSIKDREQKAILDTADVRAARDVAEAAYKYAQNRTRALENELKALQSINSNVRQMFATAGVGER